MRSSACRRHSASCARRLRAAAAHETAGQRQRQCFAHGTLSTARSSLCIIPGRRLHCDRSRAHLKNIWKAFPRSIHDPDYNNTTYNSTATATRKHAATQIHADLRHNGTGRGLRSYCCQVLGAALPCRRQNMPPASASAQHRHTSTYGAAWHRPNERGRALAARRILRGASLPKRSFCCGWPPPAHTHGYTSDWCQKGGFRKAMGGGQKDGQSGGMGRAECRSRPNLEGVWPNVEGRVEMRDLDLERATCRRPPRNALRPACRGCTCE